MLIRRTIPLICILLFSCFALSLLACNGLAIGKPSTSAPRASDSYEHQNLCAEKRRAIDDWQQEQKRKIEDEWVDEERGFLQSITKMQRMEEEADAMRRTLRQNCAKAYMEKWGTGQ